MARDTHLNTGEYDPEKYWGARAKNSKGSVLSAVCTFAGTEDENKSAHLVHVSAIDKALKDVDIKDKDILEFGCGAGRWISCFQNRGARWHGVDISQEMIDLARNQATGVELKKIVDNTIPFPDESMDIVYSITVIHHNPHDAQEKIATEMSRVIKKGGYLLILESMLISSKSFNMFPRSRQGWIELFEKHGFTPVYQDAVSYWVLRNAVAVSLGWLWKSLSRNGSKGTESKSAGSRKTPFPFRKFLGKLDLLFAKYLWRLIPQKLRHSALILFRKT